MIVAGLAYQDDYNLPNPITFDTSTWCFVVFHCFSYRKCFKATGVFFLICNFGLLMYFLSLLNHFFATQTFMKFPSFHK